MPAGECRKDAKPTYKYDVQQSIDSVRAIKLVVMTAVFIEPYPSAGVFDKASRVT
jgi:hypothetical protein